MAVDAPHQDDVPLTQLLADIAAGRPVEFGGVSFVRARVHGLPVRFVTDFDRDPIQGAHRAGRFYEMRELHQIRQMFPPGGIFADFGANVGNHGLYAALFCHASRVIPVEPNPRAWRLLLANILANGLEDRFDLRGIGHGVGAAGAGGYALTPRVANLGAARMVAGAGDIWVRTGDEVLEGISPDFIKIDVEGMELEVLAGLAGTLARCSPSMLVEVDIANEAAFQDWVAANGYAILRTTQPFKANRNHFLRPRRRRLAEAEPSAEAAE